MLTTASRVRETTTTTGTGTVTLAGAASGYRTFTSVVATGDQCNYVIALGAEWEVGVGTMASTTTLARTVVLASSNAGALVNFSAGTKDVFLTQPAALMDSMLQRDRNLLHNGAMNVYQRGIGGAGGITTTGYYSMDRWNLQLSALGTWTQSGAVESVAIAGTEFSRSYECIATTADAAPAAGDYAYISQWIEGQFLQHLMKGTANAKALSLSFWVKGSQTGTYVATLWDLDNSRWVSAAYTISAGSTWEYKTITFPADTTGVLDNDENPSLMLMLWLAAGSTYSGGGALGTAWNTTVNTRAVGQTNVASAGTTQFLRITGVQLEVGSIATPFETRRYGDELRRCQRYFRKTDTGTAHGEGGMYGYGAAGGQMLINIPFPVPMRAIPVCTVFGNGPQNDFIVNNCTGPLLTANKTSYSVYYNITTLGQFSAYANNAYYLTFSSEI